MLVCSSADGSTWTQNLRIGQTSKAAPSLSVFANQLRLSFIANNSSNTVLICSSNDGQNWTNNIQV